ncbi:hypothetical protein NLI96_g1475 [Meripilus lineatus]|uniref:Peptidase metallopeptidase domain-containing protein n=1 Tax=Meripilus lineatus TaxID=2056292 RepID=A0AAD5VAQ5_9APHY|nr:hypothetical protein NLI96_g1475 [Physisporinus lineatus]
MHRDDPIAQESLVDRRSLSSSGLIVSPLKLCNAGSTGAAGDTSPDQSTENPVHLSALEDLSPEFQKHTTCRGISIKNEFLWPQSEEITYSYISGNHRQHSKVDSGITRWSHYINLTFRRVSSGGSIRISLNDNEGSWSYLGALCLRAHIDSPTMNLQGIDDQTEILEDREKATVLHEFGHAIGLLHEHQSPSRIGEFTLNEKGIIKYYETSHEWSRAEIQCQVIDIYKEKHITNFSQFDHKSVMMYPMYPSHTLEGLELPLNTELSEIDKAFAMVHYPRLEPQIPSPQWTVAHALDVLKAAAQISMQVIKNTKTLP